jgi:hypothetical protein
VSDGPGDGPPEDRSLVLSQAPLSGHVSSKIHSLTRRAVLRLVTHAADSVDALLRASGGVEGLPPLSHAFARPTWRPYLCSLEEGGVIAAMHGLCCKALKSLIRLRDGADTLNDTVSVDMGDLLLIISY